MESNMKRQKIAFPNGFECYYLSSREETEYIYSEIFIEKGYLKNGIVINKGDSIFDVGANIGLFSLFVNQIQENLKVYAFEPIQPIFEILQENIRLHSLHNVSLFNYGLSSKENLEKIFTFYPNMAGNSTANPLDKLDQRDAMNAVMEQEQVEYFFENVQVNGKLKTLSSVINELNVEAIDLLKIDVEGEEYEVLKGLEGDDWSKIKQVVAEVYDKNGRLEEIQKLLKTYDFDVIIEKNPLFPDLNQFNVYAIHS